MPRNIWAKKSRKRSRIAREAYQRQQKATAFRNRYRKKRAIRAFRSNVPKKLTNLQKYSRKFFKTVGTVGTALPFFLGSLAVHGLDAYTKRVLASNVDRIIKSSKDYPLPPESSKRRGDRHRHRYRHQLIKNPTPRENKMNKNKNKPFIPPKITTTTKQTYTKSYTQTHETAGSVIEKLNIGKGSDKFERQIGPPVHNIPMSFSSHSGVSKNKYKLFNLSNNKTTSDTGVFLLPRYFTSILSN